MPLQFTLAQQDVKLPAPGSQGTENAPLTSSAAPSTGADGTGAAPTTQPQAPPGGIMPMLLILIAVMVIVTWMSSRREKKRRAATEAMIRAIKKHDRVQTIGGVIGSVVEVKPDYIVLKVDESSNTRITFARSAVQQVLTTSPDSSEPAEKT